MLHMCQQFLERNQLYQITTSIEKQEWALPNWNANMDVKQFEILNAIQYSLMSLINILFKKVMAWNSLH